MPTGTKFPIDAKTKRKTQKAYSFIALAFLSTETLL